MSELVDRVARYLDIPDEELARSDQDVVEHGRVAAGEAEAARNRGERHVSARFPADVYAALHAWAADNNETASALLRRIVEEALARREHPDAASLDAAIALLQEARRRVA